MTSFKADVIYNRFLDNQWQDSAVFKNRTIYKTKTGFQVNYLGGKRAIEFLHGKYVWNHFCRTAKVFSITDLITAMGQNKPLA